MAKRAIIASANLAVVQRSESKPAARGPARYNSFTAESWSEFKRLGRPGARRFFRASMPLPESERFHREAVVRLTPNLRATWDCESPVCRSCAANRRLLSISSRVKLPGVAVSIWLAPLVEFQSDTRRTA